MFRWSSNNSLFIYNILKAGSQKSPLNSNYFWFPEGPLHGKNSNFDQLYSFSKVYNVTQMSNKNLDDNINGHWIQFSFSKFFNKNILLFE